MHVACGCQPVSWLLQRRIENKSILNVEVVMLCSQQTRNGPYFVVYDALVIRRVPMRVSQCIP